MENINNIEPIPVCEGMSKVVNDCKVEVETGRKTILVGYRCIKCGIVKQKPNPTIDGWITKKSPLGLKIYCPGCSN